MPKAHGIYDIRAPAGLDANNQRHEAWCHNYIGGVPNSAKMWTAFSKGDFGPYFGTWAPFYNIHKMYAGLRDAWLYCGNEQAKYLFLKFCDWAVDITRDLSDEQMEKCWVTSMEA